MPLKCTGKAYDAVFTVAKGFFVPNITGNIDYQGLDLVVLFKFVDNNRYVIYSGDEIIVSGTYETIDLALILNLEHNDIYSGITTITLSAYAL